VTHSSSARRYLTRRRCQIHHAGELRPPRRCPEGAAQRTLREDERERIAPVDRAFIPISRWICFLADPVIQDPAEERTRCVPQLPDHLFRPSVLSDADQRAGQHASAQSVLRQ
jgi:hypothetical protein